MKSLVMLACLLGVLKTTRAAVTASAFVNMNGIRVRVDLDTATSGQLTPALTPDTLKYAISTHPYPIVVGERSGSTQCTDSLLGRAIQSWAVDTYTAMAGALVGKSDAATAAVPARSIVLQDDSGSIVGCANIVFVGATLIERCGTHRSIEAVFGGSGNVAGHVTFTQDPSTGRRTTLTSHLQYINDNGAALGNAKFGFVGSCTSPVSRSPAAEVLDTTFGTLKVGTRAGGLAASMTVAVADLGGGAVTKYTTSPATNPNFLEIRADNDTRLACAQLVSATRSHTATVGTGQTVVISQSSRYQSSRVLFAVTGKPMAATILTHSVDMASCPAPSPSPSPFNPLSVSNPTGSVAVKTPDKYSAGDLTTKYTLAADLDVCDDTLTTFGVYSVLRRGVVVQPAMGPSLCANLIETATVTTTMAKAVFASGTVRGTVTLQQVTSGAGQPITTISSSELKVDGATSATMKHNWHVHTNGIGYQLNSSACGSDTMGPLGHYNPFTVSTMDYPTQCLKTNPLRCELGDLTGKSGTIDMKIALTLQDVYLPLSGLQSIIGRSIVIHAASGAAARIGCANIIPMASVDFVIGASKATAYAKAAFQTALTAHSADLKVEFAAATVAGECQYIVGAISGTGYTMFDAATADLGAFKQIPTCTGHMAPTVTTPPTTTTSSASTLNSAIHLVAVLLITSLFV